MLKPKLDPSSDEYVLDQLSDCEHKLVGLVEELSSRELETIHKEMEDEEVSTTITINHQTLGYYTDMYIHTVSSYC